MASKIPNAATLEKVRAGLKSTDPKIYAWASKIAGQLKWVRNFSEEPLSGISKATAAPNAVTTAASRLAATVRSVGSAAVAKRAAMGAVVGNAIRTAGARLAVIGAGAASTSAATVGVAAVAGMAVVGGAVYGGHVYSNGTIAGNEKKYISGSEKMAATHANYLARLDKKKSRGDSRRQLAARPPGNEGISLEPAEQTGATPSAGKTGSLDSLKGIASSPHAGNLIDNSNTTGSAANPVAGASGPADAARANDQVNADSKKLSPDGGNVPKPAGDTTPGGGATAEKKAAKKSDPNLKNKVIESSKYAIVGAALGGIFMPTALSGLGIGLLAGPVGGALLGAGVAFALGWMIWKATN